MTLMHGDLMKILHSNLMKILHNDLIRIWSIDEELKKCYIDQALCVLNLAIT